MGGGEGKGGGGKGRNRKDVKHYILKKKSLTAFLKISCLETTKSVVLCRGFSEA
jgi:hypothetical protein